MSNFEIPKTCSVEALKKAIASAAGEPATAAVVEYPFDSKVNHFYQRVPHTPNPLTEPMPKM